MRHDLDDRDRAIVAARMAALDARPGPRVGDYVRFADGTLRRISYHWHDGDGWDGGYQTSDGGTYYLGDGYVSMSGALHPCVPADTLAPTAEARDGSVWIFHHDVRGAGRGVDTVAAFRVYACSAVAP